MLLSILFLTFPLILLVGLIALTWPLEREIRQIRREIEQYQQESATKRRLAQEEAHQYFARRIEKGDVAQ